MADGPLAERHCEPCRAGTPPIAPEAAAQRLNELEGWEIVGGNKSLRKTIVCKNFVDAASLIQRLVPVAESNDHHPDLHLTDYKHLTIELSTHAIGGLSENDFILAAKLDRMVAHLQSP
ncbi:MAG TPA: 4a-hydroxytetrahydrobiopterin dehydratase [bacterium]